MFCSRLTPPLVAIAICIAMARVSAAGCPPPLSSKRSLGEEIKAHDVAVIATITVPPDVDDTKFGIATFRVERVLKGRNHLHAEKDGGLSPIEATYEGGTRKGTQFLFVGSGSPAIKWEFPWRLSERGIDYVLKLEALPSKGPDRLRYFLPFLEDRDPTLSFDAFSEVSRGSYHDLKAVKPLMEREKLSKAISSKEVWLGPRQPIYSLMLGISGTKDDAAKLLEILEAKPDERQTTITDAVMVAYLLLDRTDKAVKFVEGQFITARDAIYADRYSAIMAFRFLADEEPTVLSKKQAIASFHKILDRPGYADLVIPDLARWEDWSVMDRLVEMFKKDDSAEPFLRSPIAEYLMVCPLPAAKAHLSELRKLDPKSVGSAEKNLLRSKNR